MKNQPLLEDEEILYSSNDKTITLSNKRIRQSSSTIGAGYFLSIPLENISTIELHYTSRPVLLAAGIICIVAGLALGISGAGMALGLAVVTGAAFILFYFLSRKHILTVASNGGARMNILTTGISNDAMLAFANTIENARNSMKQTEQAENPLKSR